MSDLRCLVRVKRRFANQVGNDISDQGRRFTQELEGTRDDAKNGGRAVGAHLTIKLQVTTGSAKELRLVTMIIVATRSSERKNS